MAVHRALYIAELTKRIVEHTSPAVYTVDERSSCGNPYCLSWMSEGSYRDVMSLMEASKVFREAALDVIWHKQSSLVPILRSVGLLVKATYDDTLDFNQWECHGTLDPAAVPTFLNYSRRIKFFDFARVLDHKIKLFVDPRSSLSSAEILFPALKGFRDAQRSTRITQFILASSNPGQLRSFCILPNMLYDIAFTSAYVSGLTALDLRFPSSNASMSEALRAILARAKALQSLKLFLAFDLSFSLLEEMSRCPLLWCRLQWLKSATAFSNPRIADIVFPHVSNLSIASPDIASLVGSLNATFPKLQVVELRQFGARPSFRWLSDEDVALFVKTVASRCPPSCLQVLRLTFSARAPSELLKNLARIPADVLHPLFKFHCLTELRINISRSWDLDRAFIGDILRAFPRVEYLVLEPCPPTLASPCRVTIQDLELFATHSRHLRVLGIEVDLSPVALSTLECADIASPTGLQQTETSSLMHLRLGDTKPPSEKGSRLCLVAYLSNVFPKLESLQPTNAFAENGEAWSQLSERMSLLNGLRSQRRTVAAAGTMLV